MPDDETQRAPHAGRIVAARTFANPLDAQWARIRLEERGIPVFLEGEQSAYFGEVAPEIRLMVREQDAESALRLLDSPEADGDAPLEEEVLEDAAEDSGGEPSTADDSVESEPRLFKDPRTPCPRCGSNNVAMDSPASIFRRLLLALTPSPGRRRKCLDCGTRFRGEPAADQRD